MYLGIEIGGTKLQVGIGAGDGQLAGIWRESVDVAAGPEGIRKQLTRAFPELLERTGIQRSAVAGVGIGFGGPVDDSRHRIIKSHQIEGWDDFPLADWVAEVLGCPAILGNDADVAGLAEALFGAGKGLSPIFYITLGSGIGGGLVIDGQMYRGHGRGAAEIGHLRMPVVSGGEMRWLPLEQLTSGWAIGRQAQAAMAAGWDAPRRLPDTPVTAEWVARLAEQGDRQALAILHDAWSHLADAICHVIALLCPRRIVIGGGVSLMGERILFEPLRALVAERVFRPFAGYYDIVPAALGEEVVVQGALGLARLRFEDLSRA
ncbi:MAG TPA: ROK family protein [Gemmataceae bacterium]|nr:ROK family protein [Gemmataceae bacterium]